LALTTLSSICCAIATRSDRFGESNRPSSLAQAIIEVGRINKTIYLLTYVDYEDYRRRILTQLNRTESRYGVAARICHGRHDEIRKRYREGQEDQLGALGLVTNTVVLWTTIYIQDALHHLQQCTQDPRRGRNQVIASAP
jgi:TnpA family transposase